MEHTRGHTNHSVSPLAFYMLLRWNHENVACCVYQGYMPHTIFLQHMKIVTIDVPKYSMPQETRRQCTLIMVIKVCIILCLCRLPFQLQQFVILPSYHDDYFVRRPCYFKISIKNVNGMALLDPYVMLTAPSTFSFNTSKKSLPKVMWQTNVMQLNISPRSK
jgi:hypothetical protein